MITVYVVRKDGEIVNVVSSEEKAEAIKCTGIRNGDDICIDSVDVPEVLGWGEVNTEDPTVEDWLLFWDDENNEIADACLEYILGEDWNYGEIERVEEEARGK